MVLSFCLSVSVYIRIDPPAGLPCQVSLLVLGGQVDWGNVDAGEEGVSISSHNIDASLVRAP